MDWKQQYLTTLEQVLDNKKYKILIDWIKDELEIYVSIGDYHDHKKYCYDKSHSIKYIMEGLILHEVNFYKKEALKLFVTEFKKEFKERLKFL